MLAAILGFLNLVPGLGKVAQAITASVYDAKVKITQARIGGDRDVAVSIVTAAATTQSSFYAAVAQSKILAFIVLGFALPWIAYNAKVVFVDNVWCVLWGIVDCSTPAIKGQVGEWGHIIILSIFGSGTTLALGNMWFNRKDKA